MLNDITSVTVADVAREAKVSKATAARVLGRYGVVSEAVRQKVTDAAARLNYRPNELARSMTTGRSGTIGVVVGDIENPFFSVAVRGITDLARNAGLNVILTNSSESLEEEEALVGVLLGKQVDGFIITPANGSNSAHLLEITRQGRPLVLLDRTVDGLDVDSVTVNDYAAAYNAVEALVAAGHKSIAFVTGSETPLEALPASDKIQLSTIRGRIEGMLTACIDAGLDASQQLIRYGARNADVIGDMLRKFRAEPIRPTAVIASDSLIGMEIFRAARSTGISIPRELSLIVFHNDYWTTLTDPQIAVVEQPVYDLGRTAAELLVRRLRSEVSIVQRLELPTQLLPRESISTPFES